MSAEEKVNLGNEAYMDEEFDEAVRLYTAALEIDPKNYNALVRRSQTFCKLKQFERAAMDAQKAIDIDPERCIAYHRKAEACFGNDEYSSALKAAKEALKHGPSAKEQKEMQILLEKCQAELAEEKDEEEDAMKDDSKPAKEEPKESNPPPAATAAAETAAAAVLSAAAPPVKAGPKVRHDWLQNNDAVTITLYVKSHDRRDVSVEFEKRTASVTIKMADNHEFSMEWELFDEIVPEKSTYSTLNTKVELRLVKAHPGAQWRTLTEDAADDSSASRPTPPSSAPTSSKNGPKDWDKLVKEAEAEEPEPKGDEALDALFKQIFANGTDDQRRAMIKSYTESGGTVLSTNWEEVKQKHVDGAAPKGQVMHRWDELTH